MTDSVYAVHQSCICFTLTSLSLSSPQHTHTHTLPIFRIGSMRKNGVVNGSIHPSRDTSSSPIEVKQSSPSSLSQCSSQSCGSAGSAKSLPVTIPAQEQLSFPFTRQTSDPGLLGYSSPTEDNSPTQVYTTMVMIGQQNMAALSSELPLSSGTNWTEQVSILVR